MNHLPKKTNYQLIPPCRTYRSKLLLAPNSRIRFARRTYIVMSGMPGVWIHILDQRDVLFLIPIKKSRVAYLSDLDGYKIADLFLAMEID